MLSKFVLMITFLSSAMANAALPRCDVLAESGPSQLIQYLKDGKTGTSNPACVEYAIKRLGDAKMVEALPMLASYLVFHRPETEREKMGMGGAIETPGNDFPAISAISQMGRPALPTLVHVIEEEQSGSQASQNAGYAVVKILNSRLDAIRFLKRSAAAAKSSQAQQRLSDATQQVLTWCHTTERTACESALLK